MKLRISICMSVLTLVLSAQTVQVKTQYKIKEIKSKAYYPVFNNAGNKILYSQESYNGLYLFDMDKNEVKQLSQDKNAGYYPIFSNDDSKVFHRSTHMENGLRWDALESVDVNNLTKKQMITPQRNLKQARNYENGVLVMAEKKMIKSTFGTSKNNIPIYVSSEDLKMFVYKNGRRTEINPLGNKIATSYIWISLSPDNQKILFTATGKGTYICDLNGEILYSLGYLNAPIWYNNEYVVGMQDKDNGELVISSTVVMVSEDGRVRKQISNPGDVAMYPAASAKAGKIVYNTSNGGLIISEIEISQK